MNKYRNVSNKLTYDFHEIVINDYLCITDAIVKRYKLKKSSQLVHGLDEIFQNFKTGEKVIGLEWDIWSGYTIVAQNAESEDLVKNIAAFVATILEKKVNNV